MKTKQEKKTEELQDRINMAIESLHTQSLYLASLNKESIEYDKIHIYFRHLENILRGRE